MARNREFNPKTVVDAALDLFWRKGYNACSMDDVVRKSGVARYGVYQEFKDKDQLYYATLKEYIDNVRSKVIKPFIRDGEDSDYETLAEHFDLIVQVLEEGVYCGCFAHQAAIERGRDDPQVKQIVEQFFTEAEGVYRKTIQNGINKGQIRELSVAELSTYVMGIQRALIAMSKQSRPIEEQKKYVRCALELLKS